MVRRRGGPTGSRRRVGGRSAVTTLGDDRSVERRSSGWSPPTARSAVRFAAALGGRRARRRLRRALRRPRPARAARLDTVVFEQYKQQGNRTYLPSPFAIVAGGDGAGASTSAPAAGCGSTSAPADPDRLVVELSVEPDDPASTCAGYRGPPADGARRPRRRPSGGLRRPPDWVVPAVDERQQLEHPGRVSSRRSTAASPSGSRSGVVVIEAWSDESTFTVFRDARHPVRADGGAARRSPTSTFPPDGAWPDPVGMVEHLHDAGVRVLLWQIPLVPCDRGDERAGRRRRRDDGRARLLRRARPTARRTATAGWWFPGALLPDWTNPDARRLVAGEAALPARPRSASTGSRPTAASTRGATSCATHDGSRGGDVEQPLRPALRRRVHDVARRVRRRRRHVQPGRVHRRGPGAVPLGRRRELDVGGVPGVDHRRPHRGGQRRGVLGVGPRPGSPGRCRPSSCTSGPRRWPRSCPIMQYHSEFDVVGIDGGRGGGRRRGVDPADPADAPAPARPDAVERRRAARRRAGAHAVPALRRDARTAAAVPGRAGRRIGGAPACR